MILPNPCKIAQEMYVDDVTESEILDKELLTQNIDNLWSLQSPLNHPVILTQVKSKVDGDKNLPYLNFKDLIDGHEVDKPGPLGL